MRIFEGIDPMYEAVGEHLGFSAWHETTQEQVDAFAEVTGGRQCIHVDPERAAAGPFGGTIAHGYLTLSLTASLIPEVYRIDGLAMAVNYGADRLRFPAPLRVGSRLRVGVELTGVGRTSAGHRAVTVVTVEAEGSTAPVCVVEMITLLVP